MDEKSSVHPLTICKAVPQQEDISPHRCQLEVHTGSIHINPNSPKPVLQAEGHKNITRTGTGSREVLSGAQHTGVFLPIAIPCCVRTQNPGTARPERARSPPHQRHHSRTICTQSRARCSGMGLHQQRAWGSAPTALQPDTSCHSVTCDTTTVSTHLIAAVNIQKNNTFVPVTTQPR